LSLYIYNIYSNLKKKKKPKNLTLDVVKSKKLPYLNYISFIIRNMTLGKNLKELYVPVVCNH